MYGGLEGLAPLGFFCFENSGGGGKPEVDNNAVMSPSKGVFNSPSVSTCFPLSSFSWSCFWVCEELMSFIFLSSFSLRWTNHWFIYSSGWKWRQSPNHETFDGNNLFWWKKGIFWEKRCILTTFAGAHGCGRPLLSAAMWRDMWR